MIEIRMRPNEIQTGKTSTIEFSIVNTYPAPCTSIVLDIQMPHSIAVIKGANHIELKRLESGSIYTHNLLVKPRQEGDAAISFQGFSFRGPDGKIQTIRNASQTLRILGGELRDQAGILPLIVSLEKKALFLNEWGSLGGQIHNRTMDTIYGLFILLSGPIETQTTALNTIAPEAVSSFQIAVRPMQSGEAVPVTLQLLSPSGSLIYSQRIYLTVVTKEVKTGPKYEIRIEQGEGLVIGDETDVDQYFRGEGDDSSSAKPHKDQSNY